jgi:hypothetical protein
MTLRAAPLLAILLLPLVMGFSKKPKFSVTFHAQAEDSDPKKTMFPMEIEGRSMLFKIVPEVSQANIVAIHPFDSPTNGKGLALQLDSSGRNALELLTRTRQGECLVAMVNAKPVDYLIIDQVIDNGMITIWRGVPDEVITEMEKKYALIKPGSPPSMNENMTMLPTTKKDKKRFWEAQKDPKKNKEEQKEPEVLKLDAPQAPVTTSIPVEGAGTGTSLPPPPAPGTPNPQPALPKP